MKEIVYFLTLMRRRKGVNLWIYALFHFGSTNGTFLGYSWTIAAQILSCINTKYMLAEIEATII